MKHLLRKKRSDAHKPSRRSVFRGIPKKLNNSRFIRKSLILSIVLCAVSGYMAYTRLYLTPERRFWKAIGNSLSTRSIVRETQAGGSGNKSIEKTRFVFGDQPNQTKISSINNKTATSESNVITESILLPTTQYVRYKELFSTEKKTDGGDYDFSKIKNVWAKQDDAKDEESKQQQRLAYIQPLITLVPFGNLSPSQRSSVLNRLKNDKAYVVDFDHVTYSKVNGRQYALYNVQVKTKKYVGALQEYLRDLGLGEFPPLNPANYPDNARVNALFLVETRGNVITAVTYNGQNEHYQDYGVISQIDLPSKTIGLSELQERLQAVE